MFKPLWQKRWRVSSAWESTKLDHWGHALINNSLLERQCAEAGKMRVKPVWKGEFSV
jgi:hypothetical protein